MPIDPAALAWAAAAAMLAIAVIAGIGDFRRKRRADLDRVGWVDWPSVQIFALIAALLLATFAFHA